MNMTIWLIKNKCIYNESELLFRFQANPRVSLSLQLLAMYCSSSMEGRKQKVCVCVTSRVQGEAER